MNEGGEHAVKEVRNSKYYSMDLVVEESEVEEIMQELTKAQETIMECYYKLERMGVVTIKRKGADSCN